MNIATLPKVELHCHLDGIISPAMVRDIQRTDPAFPVDAAALERAYPIHGLESFFNWWQYSRGMNRIEHFYPVIQRYVEQLKAQQVRYFEVMIASGELPADPAEAVDAMHAFRAWVDQCEAGTIQVEFLLAFRRNRPVEQVEVIAETILALHAAGLIAGVVLAGPEIGNPVAPFTSIFARLHDAGLKIEIHAGEWVGAESVWDAVQYGYPDRIGHGITLFDDPRLIELFQERQIHLEFCPSSNLQTGSVARVEEFPLRKALDAGLNFGINTDDPGIFGCSMNSEYKLMTEVFGMSEDDWKMIYQNSLNARFRKELRIDPV